MLEVGLQLLPAALGFALSPIALVEMILILLSKRSKPNGVLFFACIFSAVFFITLLGATGISAALTASPHQASATTGWIILLLGLLLLGIAGYNIWTRRETKLPATLNLIENMGPGSVVLLAASMTIINPKNLVFLLQGGLQAAEAGFTGISLILLVGLFSILATLPFSLAVIYMYWGGPQAAVRIAQLKDWLLRYNKVIMAVVLIIFGTVLIGRGAMIILTLS